MNQNKDEWVVVPETPAQIADAARHCRALVRRKALYAAGVAAIPIPGIDVVNDIGVLMKLIPDINRAFGLTPQQIERLTPDRRLAVYKALSTGGGMLVGKLVTRELIVRLLQLVGVRLTAQQAARYVPVAGQAISAALTFSALKMVCDQHIRQCIDVSQKLALTMGRPQPASL